MWVSQVLMLCSFDLTICGVVNVTFIIEHLMELSIYLFIFYWWSWCSLIWHSLNISRSYVDWYNLNWGLLNKIATLVVHVKPRLLPWMKLLNVPKLYAMFFFILFNLIFLHQHPSNVTIKVLSAGVSINPAKRWVMVVVIINIIYIQDLAICLAKISIIWSAWDQPKMAKTVKPKLALKPVQCVDINMYYT